MMVDKIEALELEKEAKANNGKCSHCHQTINIYKYKLNRTLAIFLRTMAQEVRATGLNDVDISTLSLPYSVHTQMTKLRLHGMIARVRSVDGAQVPSHWLITRKGWDWLGDEREYSKPQARTVIVYNNQVLGHSDGLISIHEALGEIEQKPDTEPLNEPEARTYDDVRTPKKNLEIHAEYLGSDGLFERHRYYDLEIKRLEYGKPVVVVSPRQIQYKDIAAFKKKWKVSQ